MRTGPSLRFVLMLLLTAAATIALVTMFEAVIRASLSFGTALVVVMPLLVAARSCGGAWVAQQQTPASIATTLRHGAGFAVIAWAVLLLAVLLLHMLALRQWQVADPVETARMLARRPATLLIVASLGYATTALITCTGFALGARAQARLLPQRPA